MNNLPPFDSVFFTHYDCDQFSAPDQAQRACDVKIYTLTIRTYGEYFSFSQDDERTRIEQFSNKIAELKANGLRLVHWNQDKPFYGPDHIKARYLEIAKQSIDVDYSDSINLGWKLIELYDDDYVDHPRLNNLAVLNGISGKSDECNAITRATNRVLLLQKIYTRLRQGILKTNSREVAKPDELKTGLSKYGFFDLAKVQSLAPAGQNKLLAMIATREQSYKIAMLSFLGFIGHLDQKYFPVKNDRNKELGELLGIHPDNVKKQISALSLKTKADLDRYQSRKFLKDAELDYIKLK